MNIFCTESRGALHPDILPRDTVTISGWQRLKSQGMVSLRILILSKTFGIMISRLHQLCISPIPETEERCTGAFRVLDITTESVSEIAYDCGFNNISNFNRLFKKKKGCTSKEFRRSYSSDNRVFI